eukprot:TRINITY_DN1135_c0_g1::TRINITY_DN1135_c0_g1_i1::g.17202::m.17202 TRINITY_DN1135_c0_g1::TRINITY_DN1135_c0_g1_i1::g.17202  ORF type:complete len:323 (+),score=47.88,sp/Q54KD9/RANG_DICDI/45.12/9e-34,Ran_BP1/PF00638.13/1.4e-35 TRINITY_DN1135_c0_g1_i1:132-1100(+)
MGGKENWFLALATVGTAIAAYALWQHKLLSERNAKRAPIERSINDDIPIDTRTRVNKTPMTPTEYIPSSSPQHMSDNEDAASSIGSSRNSPASSMTSSIKDLSSSMVMVNPEDAEGPNHGTFQMVDKPEPSAPGFSFLTPVSSTPTMSSFQAMEPQSDIIDGASQEPCVEFKPLVALPVVQFDTGENNEVTLCNFRAKLFRFDKLDGPQWKERGVGDFKFLIKKDHPKRVRVLMRRDQVLKICANHEILPWMKLKPYKEQRSWVWSARDYSEGAEGSEDVFAIRLGSVEKAQKFKTVFDSCIAHMEKLDAGMESDLSPADFQ